MMSRSCVVSEPIFEIQTVMEDPKFKSGCICLFTKECLMSQGCLMPVRDEKGITES